MKNRLIALILSLTLILTFSSCNTSQVESSFEITFIDVGQGDSALVKCDNHFMLIDGGSKSAAEDVERVLTKANVSTLDVLVASHLDEDHIGGLEDGLKKVKKIKHTISNSKYKSSVAFGDFQKCVHKKGSRIKVPKIGSTYHLGSAEITIVDVQSKEKNDSLVLLVTYGNTNFLFTGDIEQKAQKRVVDALQSEKLTNKIESGKNLIKMPHHGAYNSNNSTDHDNNYLNTLFTVYNARYFVISVGENNQHGHPDDRTVELIGQVIKTHKLVASKHLFRTDHNGDIIVTSNGNNITIDTTK